ncbi:MAG: flavodoxin family protein [bacterium]|nr:flavodoxin family protein [bacterium]
MSDKKVVTILLGSPRKDGNSEQLADSLAKGAEEKGYEVRKIRLAGKKLNGCLDCRKCWSTGAPCIQQDDMAAVYDGITAAAVIVFASPLYFYSWSTQIKPVWDRLLPFFAADSKVSVKGKRAVLLATAGDTEISCFDGLKSSFRLACDFTNWPVAGMICAADMYPQTDMAEKGRKYLFEAYELGKNL